MGGEVSNPVAVCHCEDGHQGGYDHVTFLHRPGKQESNQGCKKH
jgi:hypothetical protein